jgi:hypothetical protein
MAGTLQSALNVITPFYRGFRETSHTPSPSATPRQAESTGISFGAALSSVRRDWAVGIPLDRV